MSRRPRRSGIKFIENEQDRHLTYFKRRAGLTKSSADLSTLTGGKSAIVLESESGKKYAFGTPSANPIIDSFLSEHNLHIDEGETAKITHLQDELFRLEKGKPVHYTSERDQIISGEVDDLGANEVSALFQWIGNVEEDINSRVNPGKQVEVRGQSGPLFPIYSSSWHSQIKMPPRRLPWVPLEAPSQGPRSPRSQSYFLDPTTLPLAQEPHSQVLHHQENMIPPLPIDAHQHNYYFPQPQPLGLPLQDELSFNPMASANTNHAYTQNSYFNPMAQPSQEHAHSHSFNFNPMAQPGQEHAQAHSFIVNPVVPPEDPVNSHNFVAGQPPIGGPPVTPFNDIDFDSSLDALRNNYFGLADDYYEGQAAGGGHDDELDPSDLHAQADEDWLMNLFDSPFHGESFGDAA